MPRIRPDSDALEYVCDDAGQSVWKYDPEEQMYYRFKDGQSFRRITGEGLPNPEVLLMERMRMLPEADPKDIDASPASYKLWEHWNAQRQKPD